MENNNQEINQTQDNYNQPNYYSQPQRPNLSVSEWFLTILVAAIPVVNLIMLCIWAFGKDGDKRENYAKASLIWFVIGIVLLIIFYATLFAVFAPSLLNAYR